MLDTIIQSNDCFFQVKIGDDFVSTACFKSFTVTVNTDEKETTTVGDGQFKTFDYKILSYTANLNGGMRIPDSLTTTIFDFVEFQKGFIPIEFRAVWIDPAGGTRFFRGVGIIKGTNMVASASQLADGSIDILGSGEFEIGDNIQPNVSINIISTGNDLAPAFLKFKLINTDGEVIFQTDTLPQASGGVLSNPFNINVLVPTGSYYIYWYADANLIGNTFDTDAPPTLSQVFNQGVSQYSSFPTQIYDFTADRTVTFTLGVPVPPPACVAPSIASGSVLPDGQEGVAYSHSITVNGSQPFNITNVIKPSWMTITIVLGNTIILSGTPDTPGTGIPVSFDINNACGTASISDTIDVAAAPVTINTVIYDFQSPNGSTPGPWSFRIYRQGAEIVNVNNDTSGSFQVLAGENVQVLISSASVGFPLKDITIINTTDSIIIVQDLNTTLQVDFDFNVGSGKTYTLDGSVHN